MTTKKTPKPKSSETSKQLGLATLEFFRALFIAFWAGKGRSGIPTDIMVTTYYKKLKNFPEMIINRMLEDYLHDGDSRFPSVGEMAHYCRDSYGTYLARRAIKKPEPVEEDLSEEEKAYRIAVRHEVFAVLRTGGLEIDERRKLITGVVERVAREHNRLPMKEYLAWQD